jgi:hypothetical protein
MKKTEELSFLDRDCNLTRHLLHLSQGFSAWHINQEEQRRKTNLNQENIC